MPPTPDLKGRWAGTGLSHGELSKVHLTNEFGPYVGTQSGQNLPEKEEACRGNLWFKEKL